MIHYVMFAILVVLLIFGVILLVVVPLVRMVRELFAKLPQLSHEEEMQIYQLDLERQRELMM